MQRRTTTTTKSHELDNIKRNKCANIDPVVHKSPNWDEYLGICNLNTAGKIQQKRNKPIHHTFIHLTIHHSRIVCAGHHTYIVRSYARMLLHATPFPSHTHTHTYPPSLSLSSSTILFWLVLRANRSIFSNRRTRSAAAACTHVACRTELSR